MSGVGLPPSPPRTRPASSSSQPPVRMFYGLKTSHARVKEGVAKSQFPLQGSGFQKWRARISARFNEFTQSQHCGVVCCSLRERSREEGRGRERRERERESERERERKRKHERERERELETARERETLLPDADSSRADDSRHDPEPDPDEESSLLAIGEVQGAGCRVEGAGCRVEGAGCRDDDDPPRTGRAGEPPPACCASLVSDLISGLGMRD